MKPSEEDLRVAKDVLKRLRRTFNEPSAMLYDSIEEDIASALAAERERALSPNRDEAIKYLESIAAPVTEDRILLAQFLATNPTVKQIHLATSLVIEERDRTAAAEREKAAKVVEDFDNWDFCTCYDCKTNASSHAVKVSTSTERIAAAIRSNH